MSFVQYIVTEYLPESSYYASYKSMKDPSLPDKLRFFFKKCFDSILLKTKAKMVASRATIECFLYMDLSPSSSHEVKSSCYSVCMLVNIAKKLGTIVKITCFCSRPQSGSRPHQGRWSWQGGVRVAAALRGSGALPRPGEVAEGLQPSPNRPSGQIQDSGDWCHWVLYHEHWIWSHGQVLYHLLWEMWVVCNDLWLQLTHFYSHTGVLLILFSPVQLVSSCVWYLFLSYIGVTSTLLSFLSTLSCGLST